MAVRPTEACCPVSYRRVRNREKGLLGMAKKPRNRRSGRKARAAERVRIESEHKASGYVPPKPRKPSVWDRLLGRQSRGA